MKINKKSIIVAVVASIGLVFSTAAPAVASAPAAYSRNDKAFVKAVRNESPILYGVGARLLISTAKETCKFLRNGYGGVLDAVGFAEDGGLDEDTAMTIVAGAVIYYCPEQESNY